MMGPMFSDAAVQTAREKDLWLPTALYCPVLRLGNKASHIVGNQLPSELSIGLGCAGLAVWHREAGASRFILETKPGTYR
jgi:hypothetical protein